LPRFPISGGLLAHAGIAAREPLGLLLPDQSLLRQIARAQRTFNHQPSTCRSQFMRKHLVTFVLCGILSIAAPALSVGAQQREQAPSQPTVNLNTATVDQLMTLPGIGQKTAELILEYRAKNGGSFKKIEELMNVKGIGEKSFLKLKPLVSAPPKTDKTDA
jgi:competence protein ComEA